MKEYLEKINAEIEKLEARNDYLERLLKDKEKTLDCYRQEYRKFENVEMNMTVSAIYHHKQRNNTTIVFADGSSETVHLKKGDKNCLETAIAWALMKHIYNINKLVKAVQEVGE